MSKLPTLFVSHGSPMLAILDSPARRFLLELGKTLPRPSAIVVVSAHWEAMGAPAASFAAEPATIHDFGGFPAALGEIEYPAKGAPAVAAQATRLLEQAGLPVQRSAERGLDHGAWVPLSLMYPDAAIPAMQVSLVRGATPADHYRIGQALAPLRDQGALIIGSGSLTHNLHEFWGKPIDASVPGWVSEFDEWMVARLHDNQRDALFDYRRQAPFAVRNHPTEEHLLPLFVAMGAAGADAKAQRIHASYEYGALAMDAYAFS